ncbi:hypothetical protein PG999_000586 [Apiospora kogelbergensis]|uniref:Uncharacterized protein n=1 Tax=Apiospora kogelbergensis TaxID=1337665 RepID=A0AAW0RC89_9PEZI
MRFSAILVFLPGLAGLTAAKNIFKYCTEASFDGSCAHDDDDSLNHCAYDADQSCLLLFHRGSGCTGDSRGYTTGEVPNLPEMYQAFKTYKCVKVDSKM